MSSVLFDAPGPKARARYRLFTVVAGIAVLAVVLAILWKLYDADQFTQERWEPFVTPRIVNLLLEGIVSTLAAAAVAIALSIIFGLVFGPAKLSEHWWIRWPAWAVVEFFRAVPLLMLIIVMFYALGAQLDNAFLALVAGLVLYNGSVLAEIFRAGINAVPQGQSEAAYAIGMRKSAVMRIILIPQAIKIMLPSIISQSVVALKDTSLGYVITAPGLTYAGKQIYREFQNVFATGLVLAVLYIALNLVLSYFANLAQRRLAQGKKLDVPMGGEAGSGAPPTGTGA